MNLHRDNPPSTHRRVRLPPAACGGIRDGGSGVEFTSSSGGLCPARKPEPGGTTCLHPMAPRLNGEPTAPPGRHIRLGPAGQSRPNECTAWMRFLSDWRCIGISALQPRPGRRGLRITLAGFPQVPPGADECGFGQSAPEVPYWNVSTGASRHRHDPGHVAHRSHPSRRQPDAGSVRDNRPRGRRAHQPRPRPGCPRSRDRRHLDGPVGPHRRRRQRADSDKPERGSAGGVSTFRSAPAGCGDAGAVSGNQAGGRPADQAGVLLRHAAGDAVHPGRPGEDRGPHAGDRQEGRQERARLDPA